jgi:hypothetical protein
MAVSLFAPWWGFMCTVMQSFVRWRTWKRNLDVPQVLLNDLMWMSGISKTKWSPIRRYTLRYAYNITPREKHLLNTPIQLWADIPVCGLLLHLLEHLHSCTVHINFPSPYTWYNCRTNVQIMIKFETKKIYRSIVKPLQFSFRSENFNYHYTWRHTYVLHVTQYVQIVIGVSKHFKEKA